PCPLTDVERKDAGWAGNDANDPLRNSRLIDSTARRGSSGIARHLGNTLLEYDPGLLLGTPDMDTRLHPGRIVERPCLDKGQARIGVAVPRNWRAAERAELPIEGLAACAGAVLVGGEALAS